MSETKKPRVLIVDDEESIRIWLSGLLKSMGCEVVGEATNGSEGVDLFKEKRPDLVLLDAQMPVMKGSEALNYIMNEDPDANVIMLTSVKDARFIHESFDKGAQYYLPKHSGPEKIKEVLQEQLAKLS
jgi:two-component system chemotaxis response regulator CheY